MTKHAIINGKRVPVAVAAGPGWFRVELGDRFTSVEADGERHAADLALAEWGYPTYRPGQLTVRRLSVGEVAV